MATNTGNPSNPQRIAIQCSCSKRLAALPQHAGKRLKCPACGQAVVVPAMSSRQTVPVALHVEDESEGMSRKTLVAMWSFVGVFALGCVVFLVWHSHSSHQAKIAAANERISQAIAAANEWVAGQSSVDGEAIERQLAGALKDEDATEKGNGDAVLSQVRQRRQQLAEQARIEQAQRRATAIFNDAKREIDAKRVTEAITLLRKYVADPHATEQGEAQRLLAEAETAVSDMLTLDALVVMNDAAFERAKTAGTIDDGKVTHPVLLGVRSETIQRNLDKAAQRRAEMKVVEEKRREAERVAAMERRQQEEQRRQAEEARIRAKQQRQAESDAKVLAELLAERKEESRVSEDWSVKTITTDISVAISAKVHDRLNDFLLANDMTGVKLLVASGQVFMLSRGTKVRVIKRDGGILGLTEIRVLEGEHAGRLGYTETLNVPPFPP